MEEILHTVAQMEDRVQIASYQQDLLLPQLQQDVQMVEYHRTVAPMEELDLIVPSHHLPRHIRQPQGRVRSEVSLHTVVQTEELVQTVLFHHHLLPIRQPQDLVPSEVFHHTAARMAVQVRTVSFQHKVRRRPDLVPTEVSAIEVYYFNIISLMTRFQEFHHIVVPTEDLDQIAMSQLPLYHHQHDRRHHLREVITNISHPVHMARKAQNAFCQLLHHQPG